MEHYYIYHIPGVKIGCSMYPKQRVKCQGYSNYEILEVHACKYLVSDREMDLQREHGYPVDTTPYWKIIEIDRSIGGRKAAVTNKENWDAMLQDSNHQRHASAAAHQAKLEKGIYDDIGRKKRKLTFEDAEQIRKYSNEGMFQRSIAKLYGVSQRTIAMIVHYKTYKKP